MDDGPLARVWSPVTEDVNLVALDRLDEAQDAGLDRVEQWMPVAAIW